jgi:hypothetical protein
VDPARRVLVIACGALAHEIAALRRLNGWSTVDVRCLPPELHNHPERIPPAVAAEIRAARGHYDELFVAYADCGTGGRLDAVLAAEGVERIPGAHCYEFFANPAVFAALAEDEPGSFYLTDFLIRHFERLVAGTLGLNRHPELAAEYFRNYRRVVYLAQQPSPERTAAAEAIARRLGLEFVERYTGYGGLAGSLSKFARRAGIKVVVEPPTESGAVAEHAAWPH